MDNANHRETACVAHPKCAGGQFPSVISKLAQQTCEQCPCHPHGTCELEETVIPSGANELLLSTHNTFLKCKCNTPDRFGTHCEIPREDCNARPCVNGHPCVDQSEPYCRCDSGWQGAACDVSINDCSVGNLCDMIFNGVHEDGQWTCANLSSGDDFFEVGGNCTIWRESIVTALKAFGDIVDGDLPPTCSVDASTNAVIGTDNLKHNTYIFTAGLQSAIHSYSAGNELYEVFGCQRLADILNEAIIKAVLTTSTAATTITPTTAPQTPRATQTPQPTLLNDTAETTALSDGRSKSNETPDESTPTTAAVQPSTDDAAVVNTSKHQLLPLRATRDDAGHDGAIANTPRSASSAAAGGSSSTATYATAVETGDVIYVANNGGGAAEAASSQQQQQLQPEQPAAIYSVPHATRNNHND
eukprot:gene16547-7833_t